MKRKSMQIYKVVLTDRGKQIFKGGNIPVMKKMLFKFKAENPRKAYWHFYKVLIRTLGSGSEYLYKIVRG